MEISFFIILISLGVALCFLALFYWAISNGQYEDTSSPPLRMLLDNSVTSTEREQHEREQSGL